MIVFIYFAGHYYQLNFDDKSLMSLFHYFSLGGDVQVFSMLDTQSLCYAAATCALFNKCAMDSSCYANIDLTTVVLGN